MEPVDGNFNEINIKRRVRVANLNWEDPCSWIDISHNVWQGSQHEEFPWNLKWSQKRQQSKHQLNCGLHLRIQPEWEANATTINIDDCETEVVGIPFNKPIFNGAVISVVEISEKSFRQEAGSQGQAIWRDRISLAKQVLLQLLQVHQMSVTKIDLRTRDTFFEPSASVSAKKKSGEVKPKIKTKVFRVIII